ncbi:hypothetical protein [Fodinicola feengrottensis]|nr:hypothetical protein [Fodinicola feengrottensis]
MAFFLFPEPESDRPVLTPVAVVRLLAEPARLRALAAVALGAARIADVAEAADLSAKDAAKAVGQLVAGGLLSTVDGDLTVAALRQLAQDATEPAETEDFGATDPAVAGALRTFITNGRLTTMPAAPAPSASPSWNTSRWPSNRVCAIPNAKSTRSCARGTPTTRPCAATSSTSLCWPAKPASTGASAATTRSDVQRVDPPGASRRQHAGCGAKLS